MPWLRMVGHPHCKIGRAKEKGRCADGKQRNKRARAGRAAAAGTGHPVPWPSLRAAMDLCVSPTFLFWASLAACVLVLRHDAHLRGTPASLSDGSRNFPDSMAACRVIDLVRPGPSVENHGDILLSPARWFLSPAAQEPPQRYPRVTSTTLP